MNKSKFLKKSLAMLLALMLVVAMIPLSAAAAEQPGLESIYVNGSLTNLSDEFTVEVSTADDSVKVGTNEDLNGEYKLYALTSGQTKTEIPQWKAGEGGEELEFATYLQGDSIKFQLVEISKNNTEIEVATYTMKISAVAPNNLTDLASVTPRTGVYSATFDNVAKEVHVVLARQTQRDPAADYEITAADNTMNAQVEVTAANGATIVSSGEASATVSAKEGASFEVKAASGKVSKFTVVVDEYRDALDTFTITGLDGKEYTGVFSDENLDDINDTITVSLPVEAVRELPYGDKTTSPELAVSYVAAGNVDAAVQVKIGTNNAVSVASDGSKKVEFTNLGENGKETIADDSYVTVKRLSNESAKAGATQYYNLKVALELDTSTVIDSVLVNRTWAEVGEKDITVELPANWVDGSGKEIPTKPGEVSVTVNTAVAVKNVELNGVKGTSTDDKAWTWNTADLSSARILTVTAENGDRYQYNISATVAPYVSSASITGFWLVSSDGSTKIDATSIENNTITVEVPYMTINLDGLRPYITPSAGAKAQAYYGNVWFDWINGKYTTDQISGLSVEIPTSGLTIKNAVQAVSKNDETVKSTYDLKIILEGFKDGKTLENLYITAQPTDNDNDKTLFRAIDVNTNKFRAYVDEKTNGNHMVGDISMEIAPSLYETNDLGITYQNTVVEFATVNGGVAFLWKDGESYAFPLTATTNDDDDTNLTGDQLKSGDIILVLPEEVARAEMIRQNGYTASQYDYDAINPNEKYNGKTVSDYGTLYTVSIKKGTAETEAELKTFKVGEVTLSVDNTTNTITGELPWSYTTDNKNAYKEATFAEFTMSDYAVMTDNGSDKVTFFSNGDWDGDGEPELNGTPSSATVGTYNNREFLFVRNDNHTVDVWFASDSQAADLNKDQVVVKAENRLDKDSKVSTTTYTFKLTWKDASNEAEIKTFSIGNYTGAIEGRNITVNVPYGTDLTNMVATFTTSIGATVKVNDPVGGVDMTSGSTSVNYTNPVKLYVTSESTKNTVEYTVTVDEGLTFSDVNEGDWFYNNVMDAANNGYVSGYPNGTFLPNGSTTRAEFASMIAKAMGYESTPNQSESMFPDVADDFWGKAAINFCAQNGIISGYSDGTFQPNKAITRQEAAAILNNAFDLVEKFGTSSDLFTDDAKISGWAETHVYAAKASGLMKGDTAGTFRPTDTIIRAEAASILMNAKYEGLIK